MTPRLIVLAVRAALEQLRDDAQRPRALRHVTQRLRELESR